MKNFIFYYFMKDEKELIKNSAPDHASYWHNLKEAGGPFYDFSGGFVCFSAKDLQEAQSITARDPFLINNLFSQFWIKEWLNK